MTVGLWERREPQGHLWESGWTRCHQLRQKHGKKASYPSHAVEKCESGNLIAVPQPSHPSQAGENTGSWVVMLTVAWFVLIKRWSRLAHTVHSCAIWQGGRLSFLPSFLGCYLSLTTGTNRTLWFSFSFFFFLSSQQPFYIIFDNNQPLRVWAQAVLCTQRHLSSTLRWNDKHSVYR